MSRPALLLERELYRILKADEASSPWGLAAEVLLNDIFDWKGTILGPKDSPWEGAILKVRLQFSEDYNEVPPKVVFETVPFHPNIDLHTGVPCVNFLDDINAWDPNITILGILLNLQNLILNPNLENPVNIAAHDIYLKSPRLYEQLCRDCVVASRRLDAGLRPFSGSSFEVNATKPPESKNRDNHHSNLITIPQIPDSAIPKKPKVSKLSFDEYHKFWKTAATSLPPEPAILTAVKPVMIRLDGVTESSKMTEARFKDLVEEQRYIWYGRFEKKQPKKKESISHSDRVSIMKKAYSLVSSIEAVAEPAFSDSSNEAKLSAQEDTKSLPDLPRPSNAFTLDSNSDALYANTSADERAIGNRTNEDETQGDWEKEAVELEQWANDL